MADLSNKFLGVDLKNPIIVGASNLVTNADLVKRMEDAGAAAIVYKSLFEEQIQLENLQMDELMNQYEERHAEMTSLFPKIDHAGPQEHLHNLSKMVESTELPVFASLNAIYDESWIEYAKLLEETGVKGIELNFYAVPRDFDVDSNSIEAKQVEIFKEIKKNVNIRLGVKLSPYYSSPLHFIKQLDEAGVDGVVLFNRLFQPDINTDNETNYFPYNLSSRADNKLALRFAGLLFGNVATRVTSATGILNGEDVIKMILAGAENAQVVSTIYQNKPEYITEMLAELEKWMGEKGYNSLADFRGKLSKKNSDDPHAYKRAQYVDILLNSEEIFKKYPVL